MFTGKMKESKLQEVEIGYPSASFLLFLEVCHLIVKGVGLVLRQLVIVSCLWVAGTDFNPVFVYKWVWVQRRFRIRRATYDSRRI